VLLAFLCELVLCAGASGTGGFTSMAEEGGGGGKSKRPTPDGHISRTSCSLPMLGVCPLICIGEFGGLKLLCAGWISQIWHQCLIQRWKTNSRVLDVICVLLRGFTVKLRCTVLLVFLIKVASPSCKKKVYAIKVVQQNYYGRSC